jgi:hypothetical protein
MSFLLGRLVFPYAFCYELCLSVIISLFRDIIIGIYQLSFFQFNSSFEDMLTKSMICSYTTQQAINWIMRIGEVNLCGWSMGLSFSVSTDRKPATARHTHKQSLTRYFLNKQNYLHHNINWLCIVPIVFRYFSHSVPAYTRIEL